MISDFKVIRSLFQMLGVYTYLNMWLMNNCFYSDLLQSAKLIRSNITVPDVLFISICW